MKKKLGFRPRDPTAGSRPEFCAGSRFPGPNGAMATHLEAKKSDLGSLGVPGPASTPLGRRGRATGSMDPKLDLDLDISDLGFDQISSYKRGGMGARQNSQRHGATGNTPSMVDEVKLQFRQVLGLPIHAEDYY